MILFDEQLPPQTCTASSWSRPCCAYRSSPTGSCCTWPGSFCCCRLVASEIIAICSRKATGQAHIFSGLSLLGLTGGLIALQPVMAAILVASSWPCGEKAERARRLSICSCRLRSASAVRLSLVQYINLHLVP
jgi:hypothetical protein